LQQNIKKLEITSFKVKYTSTSQFLRIKCSGDHLEVGYLKRQWEGGKEPTVWKRQVLLKVGNGRQGKAGRENVTRLE